MPKVRGAAAWGKMSVSIYPVFGWIKSTLSPAGKSLYQFVTYKTMDVPDRNCVGLMR